VTRFPPETTSRKADASFAEDFLQGAEEIAFFLYGDRKQRRRIYHLAERKQIPVFKMGNQLCGRRNTFLARIAEQERQECAASGQEAA